MINLHEGRISPEIFVRHYWSPNMKQDSWSWNGGGTIAIIALSKEKEGGGEIETLSLIGVDNNVLVKSQWWETLKHGMLSVPYTKDHKLKEVIISSLMDCFIKAGDNANAM